MTKPKVLIEYVKASLHTDTCIKGTVGGMQGSLVIVIDYAWGGRWMKGLFGRRDNKFSRLPSTVDTLLQRFPTTLNVVNICQISSQFHYHVASLGKIYNPLSFI